MGQYFSRKQTNSHFLLESRQIYVYVFLDFHIIYKHRERLI